MGSLSIIATTCRYVRLRNVRAGEWSSYEVDLLHLVPRPAHIERLEVLAAGWSYRSAVRNVRLVID